jgi:hypothetical protein
MLGWTSRWGRCWSGQRGASGWCGARGRDGWTGGDQRCAAIGGVRLAEAAATRGGSVEALWWMAIVAASWSRATVAPAAQVPSGWHGSKRCAELGKEQKRAAARWSRGK